jgi:hypothetical protein
MIRRARLQGAGIRWSTEYHWDDLAFHLLCLIAGLNTQWMKYDDAPPDAFYRLHGGTHYGKTLDTTAGILNTAEMIFWLKEEMTRHWK